MKKILLTFPLLVFLSTMNLTAQNNFSPVVEDGVFYLYSGSHATAISKVEIYNEQGDLVKDEDMTNNQEKTIQCADLPSGQYYVMIHMNGEEYYSPLEIVSSNKDQLTKNPE